MPKAFGAVRKKRQNYFSSFTQKFFCQKIFKIYLFLHMFKIKL